MFAMDIEDDILLSVNDICDFVELDGNIVASDTFEFKLPCGSITVSSSDGTKLPFSVERRSNISVYRVMDESGERLLKEFSTEDFYAFAFELPPDKGKKYSVVFSGGSLPSFDSDEYTFSIAGIIGEYAVGFATYDTESDLFHGMDYKEYDVCINDAHNGYEVSPLMDKPVKALFYLACLKADEYPDEAVNAVEIWVN